MSMLNKVVMESYFCDLGQILEQLQLSNKPHLIWNMDETGIQFQHKPAKVTASKGQHSVSAKVSCNRDNITVLATVNARRDAMPPMIVVKRKTYKSVSSFNVTDAPKGTVYTYQESGWMEDVLGSMWFTKVFLKHCGPERPQLLLMDSHSSYEVIELLEEAKEEDIHILALQPHTTHRLQPLDKCVFGHLKKFYGTACTEFMAEHPDHTINKACWVKLFSEAWEQTLKQPLIQKAFLSTGIFPLNAFVVWGQDFMPSAAVDRPLDASGDHGPNPALSSTIDRPDAAGENGIDTCAEARHYVPDLPPSVDPLLADAGRDENDVGGAVNEVPVPCGLEAGATESADTMPSGSELDLDLDMPNSSELADILQLALSMSGTGADTDNNPIQEEQVPVITGASAETHPDTVQDEVFSLPKPAPQISGPSQPSRAITSHRLLTSEEVLLMKRKAFEEKDAKEKAKKQRREALEKKKLVREAAK